MSGCASVLFAALTFGSGADADTDAARVVDAVKEHFARIRSIRVRATERPVESGGLLAPNPAEARPKYSSRPDMAVSEYEVWLSWPKYRRFWTEVGRNATRAYYDGKVHTSIDLQGRRGFAEAGGAKVAPLRANATHALGICVPGTLQTSLADLLDGCGSLKVSRAGNEDGRETWLVEIKGLPAGARPQDSTDAAWRESLVRVWLTVDPEVVIRRWARYRPKKDLSDGVQQHLKARNFSVVELPVFQLEGHQVFAGYFNCDFRPAVDELRNKKVSMPRRILTGNLFGTGETTVHELVLNPKEAPDTFRPTAVAGITIIAQGDEGAGKESVGGPTGEAVRVREITRQAKEMLGAEEPLRADPTAWSGWGVPLAGATLAVFGVAAGLVARKWRSPR